MFTHLRVGTVLFGHYCDGGSFTLRQSALSRDFCPTSVNLRQSHLIVRTGGSSLSMSEISMLGTPNVDVLSMLVKFFY